MKTKKKKIRSIEPTSKIDFGNKDYYDFPGSNLSDAKKSFARELNKASGRVFDDPEGLREASMFSAGRRSDGGIRIYTSSEANPSYKKGGVLKDRNYKKEYKKFQSGGKAKKYRAALNRFNRKKGTYGNGDGLDASHKDGKIVGFEAEGRNRGRREKSRLKKNK